MFLEGSYVKVIKNSFFIFTTSCRSFSFVVFSCIKKNIGKWSETSNLIIPFFKELLKMPVVKMLSVISKTCQIFWDSSRTIYNRDCAFFKNVFVKVFYFRIFVLKHIFLWFCFVKTRLGFTVTIGWPIAITHNNILIIFTRNFKSKNFLNFVRNTFSHCPQYCGPSFFPFFFLPNQMCALNSDFVSL